MKKATGKGIAGVLDERRSGRDRRRRETPPPAGADRRRSIEPRRPEVTEVEMSADQWAALQALAYPEAAGEAAESTEGPAGRAKHPG